MKTIYSIAQAVAVGLGTYLLTSRLEGRKFQNRIKELIHSNKHSQELERHKLEMRLQEVSLTALHRKRMETLENLKKMLGTVISKLSTIPPFMYDNEPVTEEELKGTNTKEEIASRRKEVKWLRLNDASHLLNEAAEEGYLYVDESIFTRLEDFRDQIGRLLDEYHIKSEKPLEFHKALGDFKEGLKGIKKLRRDIVEEFRNQLRNSLYSELNGS